MNYVNTKYIHPALSKYTFITEIGLCNMNSNTAVRNIGIGLTLVGFILLLVYVFYEILASDGSLIPKLSIAAILLGIVVIILSLVKEKTAAKDEEIERKY